MTRTYIALIATMIAASAAWPVAGASPAAPAALSSTCSSTLVTPVTPLTCSDSYSVTCPGPFACLVRVNCSIVGSGLVGCDPQTNDALDPVCTTSLTSASCYGFFRVSAGFTQSGAKTCTSIGTLAVAVSLTCDVV